MEKEEVIVDLEGAASKKLLDSNIREGISSIAITGRFLWVAGDENISIQRLELLADGSYGKAKNFFLKDFIELAIPDEEADIEGMDVEGNYLWIVGSHSYKRKKIRSEKEDKVKEVQRLSKVTIGANRNLLARIPLIKNDSGEFELVKEAIDPQNPENLLTAAKLNHTRRKWSQLTKILRKDEHVGPFIKLPGKDNGFDIEGLAVYEERLFIGLRGPVLRGWAVIIEVQLEEASAGVLQLKKDEETGSYYKKHFLHLYGMGIRELVCAGRDLLILAGPSMDLDGTMEIYRWKNGVQSKRDQLVLRDDIESLYVFHYAKEKHGLNKAEGLALRGDKKLLIAFDSPDEERKLGNYKVIMDLVPISS